jgi:prepilin-type N-terminal cleavage/methylation domain-containing protein
MFTFVKNQKNKQQAFTLVETLVAISVLLIAVVAPLTTISEGVLTANIAKDQVTAQYLAQEGVEIVRLIRDTNILNGNSWLSSTGTNSNPNFFNCVSTTPGSPSYCNLSPMSPLTNPSTSACTDPADSSTCSPLNLFDRAPNGAKTYAYGANGSGNVMGNWSVTTFKRAISVVEIIPNQEAEVTSIVTWTTGSYPRTVTVKERLFKWN